MPFCINCGHQNPDEARFCSQCGTRLVTGDQTQTIGVGQEQRSEPRPPPAEPATGDTATHAFGAPDRPAGEAEGLGPADSAAVDALPSGHALLIVQRGPGAGNRFLLDQDLVAAGRHPESEIFLDDITVSRRHVEFRRTPEGFSVADVGSLNGTYVNRDRIDEVALQDGDEVQIGKYRLVFFASHADQIG